MFEPYFDPLKEIHPKSAIPGFRFWEYKDKLLHRGTIGVVISSANELSSLRENVRESVLEIFKPGWLKGFAFGTVLQFRDGTHLCNGTFADCVDSFNNSKGVWQWVIAIDHKNRRVFATHMWMLGWLHHQFEKNTARLIELGYDVQRNYVEKPSFFRFVERWPIFAARATAVIKFLQALLIIAVLIYLIYEFFL